MEVGVHLNWFAALVNHGNKKVNARLDADIDFTEYTRKDVMIGGDAFSASESDDVVYNLLAEAAPGIWFLSAVTDGHPVLYDTGVVSGISQMAVQSEKNNVYYDLQGRRVSHPSKGIYITNGHKVVIK